MVIVAEIVIGSRKFSDLSPTKHIIRLFYLSIALFVGLASASAAEDKASELIAACDRAAGSPADKNLPAGILGVTPEKIDPKIAIPACEAAAQAFPNDDRIIVQLGRAYGAAKDFEAARIHYDKANRMGNPLAANNLGSLYAEGRGGLLKDDREAARLFKLAADKGIAVAQNNLAAFYQNGRGGLPKDEIEAVRLHKLAADQGIAGSQNALGFMFQNGFGGLAKDDREAAHFYQLSADQGFASAQSNLGTFYQNGRGGLPKDEAEAARFYRLAANQGNAFGQSNLGVFYEEGRGGLPKDENKAARLYKLAADQKNAVGQSRLGFLFQTGRGGLIKSEAEAARLHRLAADQGIAASQSLLGTYYQNGQGGLAKDDIEAVRLYKLSADQGYAPGQFNLGSYYQDGHGGLPKDEREAARLYQLASGQNNAFAQRALGLFYQDGRGGVRRDEVEAARLFKLSADQGNRFGQFSLGRFYEDSRGGLKQDDREAARLFKLAADQGDPNAQIALDRVNRRLASLPNSTRPGTNAQINKSSGSENPASKGSIVSERRVALVIGNSAYLSVPLLPNPIRDAATVAQTLRQLGFQSVKLINNTTREMLVEALRDFAKEADKSSWALIYYAGHGIEMGGMNYLIPIDAKLVSDRDVQFEAIGLEQAMSAAEGATKLRLILLDACRDNPFLNQIKRAVSARSIGRGLSQVEPDSGMLVVYAAKHGQVALDGDGKNSPFVTALVKRMLTPQIEIRKLFDLVRDDVMEATGRQQQPFSYGSVPGNKDFYFLTARAPK